MRHRYDTRGIVLARSPLGEANALVTLLTPELGLVRARAQSLRSPGAKLAPALTTLTESAAILIRGKEGWRLAGAVSQVQWFTRLPNVAARERAGRVSGLLLRLVAGEAQDSDLFLIMRGYLEALATLPHELHDAAEVLAVLRTLAVLGLDTGDIPGGHAEFTSELLMPIGCDKTAYVARINTGIAASGL
jgi:DNA repair protein RecO (recombination protein O)